MSTAEELADCRGKLMRLAIRIQKLVGESRAAVATDPILKALGEVEGMRHEAARMEGRQ
jgi:hypothetical protein